MGAGRDPLCAAAPSARCESRAGSGRTGCFFTEQLFSEDAKTFSNNSCFHCPNVWVVCFRSLQSVGWFCPLVPAL